MVVSFRGKKNLECDGVCYGKKPCPAFETCQYNPKIKKEF